MVVYNIGMKLSDVEKEVIIKTLSFFHGNKSKTAEALDIAIRTIDNKLAKYRGETPNEGLFEPEEPEEKPKYKLKRA